MTTHSQKIAYLQSCIKALRDKKGKHPLVLRYGKGHSNTTRTKAYKQQCSSIDFRALNEVIHIDPNKRIAIVEPRVTMKQLLQATLPYRLAPPIVPEFKEITVGGAIMGGAGESGSHAWGCFNDSCLSHDIIAGDGELLHVSPSENEDIYYGIAGSYGSLGALVNTQIQLIPVNDDLYLTYHIVHPLEAIEKLTQLRLSSPLFLDGMIFSKEHAVIVEGRMECEEIHPIPRLSLTSPFTPWFYQHVKHLPPQSPPYREKMAIEDYFFRYDLGGFWMGALLFQHPFLVRFISEGILGLIEKESFSPRDIQRLHCIKDPPLLGRALLYPLVKAKNLWGLLHRAERWVQNRMIIQDFSIPESNAKQFCEQILDDPAIFPLWLCPIQGTHTPQIFTPHVLTHKHNDSHFINFGIYGIPSTSHSIRQITKKLEQIVQGYEGRKALYSHSYYSEDEFWQIYSRSHYERLRNKMQAEGMWHSITDKVLSP